MSMNRSARRCGGLELPICALHQLDVILAALRGESLLLVSATGSGKSLCFQLPILLSHGCGFVISPLKALMSQQVADLTTKKIPGTFINGDLGPQEKKIRYQLLRDGAIKFLYCTPERFDPSMVRQAEVDEIVRTRPAYLVIDEAHCIDRWGNDFRPNYGKLGAIRQALGSPPVLAFTATAGRQSQRRILESLGIPDARVVVTGVDRPNIKFVRLPDVKDEARYLLIMNLLRIMPHGRAMLFVPTVNTGKRLQAGLRSLGLDIPFFHSKLGTANDRDMLLGQFTGRTEPPVNVVICTNAFGMGLDLPDVRLVVHWQYPASVEDYLQEFGRAGRDRKPSVAVMFTGEKDEGLLGVHGQENIRDGKRRCRVQGVGARSQALRNQGNGTHCDVERGRAFAPIFLRTLGKSRRLGTEPSRYGLWNGCSRGPSVSDEPDFCCDQCDDVNVDDVEAVTKWAGGVFARER